MKYFQGNHFMNFKKPASSIQNPNVSLVKPNGRVWIVPDGDKAGERHAQTLLSLISPHRFVRWVKMADGKQPTDLSKQELKMSFLG